MSGIEISILAVTVAIIAGIVSNLALERIHVQQHQVGAVVLGLIVAAVALQVIYQSASGRRNDSLGPSLNGASPASASPTNSGIAETSTDPTVSESTSADTAQQSPDTDSLPPDISVRRKSGAIDIKLRNGYGVDLDNLDSPNWSVSNALPSGHKILRQNGSPDTDIGWDDKLLILIGDGALEKKAEYDVCVAETAYGPDDYKDLQSGDSFCIKTSENRYASLTIVRATATLLVVKAVVWDPPIT